MVDCYDSISGDLDLTGVRGIAGGAFECCEKINGVIISDDMTNIAEDAFSWCGSLADEKGFVIVGPEQKLKPFIEAKNFELDLKMNPEWKMLEENVFARFS